MPARKRTTPCRLTPATRPCGSVVVPLRGWIPLLGLSLVASPVFAADPWRLPGWTGAGRRRDPRALDRGRRGHGRRDNPLPGPRQARRHRLPRPRRRRQAGALPARLPRRRPLLVAVVPGGQPQAAVLRLLRQSQDGAGHGADGADFPAPGGGPPTGGWVPHCGFVYQTIDRPHADDPAKEHDPDTIDEMVKLIAGSKAKTAPASSGASPTVTTVRIVGLLHQHLSRLGARAEGGASTSSAPSPTRRRSRSSTARSWSTGRAGTRPSAGRTARSTPWSS